MKRALILIFTIAFFSTLLVAHKLIWLHGFGFHLSQLLLILRLLCIMEIQPWDLKKIQMVYGTQISLEYGILMN